MVLDHVITVQRDKSPIHHIKRFASHVLPVAIKGLLDSLHVLNVMKV